MFSKGKMKWKPQNFLASGQIQMSKNKGGIFARIPTDYHGDNIKTPPVAKTLFQNIWEIFENMKTQKKTFENIFLEISKPWIDAREAREKKLGF